MPGYYKKAVSDEERQEIVQLLTGNPPLSPMAVARRLGCRPTRVYRIAAEEGIDYAANGNQKVGRPKMALTPEQSRLLLLLDDDGRSLLDMANVTGLSPRRIANYLVEQGRPRREGHARRLAEALRLYQETDKPLAAITEQTGITGPTIYLNLAKLGAPLRSKG